MLREEHKSYLAGKYNHEKFGEHFNVPILLGGNYTVPGSNKLALFGELQGGFNFFKVTTSSYLAEGRKELLKYKPSLKPAFKVGAGLTVSEKVSFGVHYYALGTHRLKYASEDSETGADNGGYANPIKSSSFTVSFGVNF